MTRLDRVDVVRLETQIAAVLDRVAATAAGALMVDHGLLAAGIGRLAAMYAAQLIGDDIRLASQTAADLAGWDPDSAETAWWAATPLGRACAATYQAGDVSIAQAGAMLGVSRARVYQLLDSGKLTHGSRSATVARTSISDRLRSAPLR